MVSGQRHAPAALPTEKLRYPLYRARSGIVVKALRYKPAGLGFDSRCCHSISHYGPGVDSASNRNEYQVYFQGVKTAGA